MNPNIFGDQKIEYPVSFLLRLVMLSADDEADDISRVFAILDRGDIAYSEYQKEKTGTGKYYKLHIPCTVPSQNAMDDLYKNLRLFDRIKAAV